MWMEGVFRRIAKNVLEMSSLKKCLKSRGVILGPDQLQISTPNSNLFPKTASSAKFCPISPRHVMVGKFFAPYM